ncbi:MAG: hypothetical protein JNN07_08545 [Verrucomicrobiales bacterium]|nr:hypothetical protein [Verrucomicrobiales bacterium]
MGCVIDHLRADHEVRVLRDFVDQRKIRVRAGEQGVLRRMDVDFGQNEIYLDLERQGTVQRLVFGLSSKEGPGSGRMREFFELGQFVSESRTIPAKGADPVGTRDRHSADQSQRSADASRGEAPRPAVCLDGVAVACGCDPLFHRSLIPTGHICVHACLRCGTVTCAERVGDDGRYTGEAFIAYRPVQVPEPILRWLALWPRVNIDHAGAPSRWPMSADLVRYPTLYYPADLRCETIEALSTAEARLTREQATLSRTEAIRKAKCPSIRPPAGMPPMLQGFVALWEALQLSKDSDVTTLIYLAQLRSPASVIAADLLIRRADAFQILKQALDSSDATWNSAGIAMARDFRGDRARLAELLLTAINQASLDPSPELPGRVVGWSRLESLLVAVGDLRLNSPEVIRGLTGLRHRLSRSDDTLRTAIDVILHELNSSPVSPS